MNGAAGGPAGTAARGGVARLLRVAMPVADLARAVAFYRDALGFVPEGTRVRGGEGFARATGVAGARAEVATLRLGGQTVELERHSPPGRPYPAGSRSQDLWFQHVAVIVADLDAAYRRLSGVGCAAISLDGPEQLPESSGGVRAFKFRDPDGHPLELLQFPAGREPHAWRAKAAAARRSGEPCLGLDHSAIGVAEAGRSARFYAGLGLARTQAGVNSGPAQSRMDGAAGAVVDVVAMTPAGTPTPHVELLGYWAPADGRPMPADAAVADILATRLVLEVAGLDEAASALERAGARFVTAGVVQGDEGRVAMVRDPDGHLLVLTQG
jgi:catechol 2,3-dioxygenase-like lactoylglutathione lyase family enzyme